MIEIPLTKGRVAIVDDCDAHLLKYKWHSHRGYGRWSHKTSKDICHVSLHHAIMGRPLGKMEIDHINGNPGDCRRSNLRIVTHRENVSNQPEHRGEISKSSRFTGVHRHGKRWVSKIKIHGKTISLGRFTSEEEAGAAYQKALKTVIEIDRKP